MELVTAQPNCEKCNRHVECGRPGIPSRLGDRMGTSYHGPALFMVGEQPGWNETREGKCFVGKSGAYLKIAYLDELVITHFSKIYYGNAVRCENRRNIGVSHLGACRPYLMADIRSIILLHGSLVILAMGRYASMCLLNRGARDAFKVQGKPLPGAFWLNYPRTPKGTDLDIAPELLPKKQIPVFSTYHPAALMSGRNPAYRRATADHLALMCRAMEQGLESSHEAVEIRPSGPVDLPILRDVKWTSPGAKHRIPEPD